MADELLPVETILARLAEGPLRITEATAGLTPEQLRIAPASGEWSASEVLAHIRACGTVWGDYIRRILAEDVPKIRAVSPRAWVRKTDYREQDFKPAFEAFSQQRAELLQVLESLAPKDWARKAIVTGVGNPIERTVWNYADRLAVHERGHLKQIEETAVRVRS